MNRTKLVSEDQILDEGFRRLVIEEIKGPENVRRKNDELRKYEVYRDRTKKWVMDALAREGLSRQTLEQMETRASNISICRKVVNKLAQNYVRGVTRKWPTDQTQKRADLLAEELDINQKMKKVDQYVQLFKNTMLQIIPEKSNRESRPDRILFRLKARALPPWMYDVIEDSADNEIPRVVVLTDFVERNQTMRFIHPGDKDGREGAGELPPQRLMKGDGREQVIADRPEDEGQEERTFIWWSDHFHFTTDENGKVLPNQSPVDLMNPVQILPFLNFSEDQDGSFWAEGGDDLIDGSILINKMITDRNSIAYQQGWGQLVITGKDVPKVVELGPHKALVINQESTDEPTPQVFYASAAPDLGAWDRMIEQTTALVLSTNNLSPTNVAGKLDAQDFPSGIAMLIENSQSTANMMERQNLFRDQEPVMWEVIRRWYSLFFERKALTADFMAIGPIESSDVNVRFEDPAPVVTEKEKVDILKARKELGIDTVVDLIRRDDPSLSDEEAEKKAMLLLKEKSDRMRSVVRQMKGEQNGSIQESREETSEDREEEERAKEVNG